MTDHVPGIYGFCEACGAGWRDCAATPCPARGAISLRHKAVEARVNLLEREVMRALEARAGDE